MRQNPQSLKQSGMTLIELMIAMAVLAIGIMGTMSALLSVDRLESSNHEQL